MNSSFWISIFIQRKDGKKVMNYKIVEQVSRKKKSMSGVLRVVMIIFAVAFVGYGNHDFPGIYASGISACRAVFCL